MHERTTKKPGAALLLLASMAYTAAAHAADDSFALGGALGYGDNTRIYRLQAVWAPQKWNEMLAPHDLGLRLTDPPRVERQNQAAERRAHLRRHSPARRTAVALLAQ